MRYLYALVALFTVVQAMSQTLVSTNPELRRIVVEEFTGIYCGYCPDGATKVQAILDKYPGRAMAIGIHSSNQYSLPQNGSGHPDFRTTHGPSFQTLSGLNAFPAGMISRSQPPAGQSQCCAQSYSTSLAMNRTNWMSMADDIIDAQEYSPVNVGLRTTWNETTRELTIDCEVYFTASEPAEDRLHVMITESNIIGFQSDYTNGNTNYYNHKHVLRQAVTNYIGELIATTTQGTLFTKTYTVTIPASWKIQNCEVVAFVTDVARKETRTGVEIPAMNASTGQPEIAPGDIAMNVYPNPTAGDSKLQFSLPQSAEVQVEVLNLIGEVVSKPFQGLVAANKPQVVALASSEFKAGIYFVRIQVGDANKTVKLRVID
jgi:hypothetical protein